MRASILIETIKTLDRSELSDFTKYVQSPFFNAHKNADRVIALLDYIQQFYPKLENNKLNKAVVYCSLFPQQPIVKGKLEKLMSQLLKLLKGFLIYQYSEIQSEEKAALLSLATAYKEKGLTTRFDQTIDQLRRKLNGIGNNKSFYYYQYMTEQLISEFNGLHNQRKGNLNLPETVRSLDIYYILNKLENSCVLLSQNKLAPSEDPDVLMFLPEITHLIDEGYYHEVLLIKIYYHIFRMLQSEENEASYRECRSLLRQHAQDLAPVQLNQFQTYARNYCIEQYNRGRKQYLEELFDLYGDQLKDGSIYYDGKLRPSTIKNIVNLGLKLNQFDWVKTFLDDHQDKITGTQYPEEVYHFNMALYYFHRNQYQQAIERLAATYEDTFYNIEARRLEIKIYYEEDSVLLEAKVDALKALIFRMSKKILSASQKERNNRFVDMLRQLIHPKTYKNEERINKIRNKIEGLRYIVEKEWLLEKLEELR